MHNPENNSGSCDIASQSVAVQLYSDAGRRYIDLAGRLRREGSEGVERGGRMRADIEGVRGAEHSRDWGRIMVSKFAFWCR